MHVCRNRDWSKNMAMPYIQTFFDSRGVQVVSIEYLVSVVHLEDAAAHAAAACTMALTACWYDGRCSDTNAMVSWTTMRGSSLPPRASCCC